MNNEEKMPERQERDLEVRFRIFFMWPHPYPSEILLIPEINMARR